MQFQIIHLRVGLDALKFNWLDTDEEPDKDIFWDAESCKLDMHMDCESESEEEIFWDSLSQLEEEIETVKGVNRDISEMFVDDEKCEFNNGPFKEVWDNIYKTETFEDIPKLNKDSKKREVRSRKEFIVKFILFSVIIRQVAIAKEIGGMVVQNKIQK